jgi:energy-coupling factor transporter transmembrane protein EcfT
LVSALGKVDTLAVSMEGRCFGKYPTRTFLREVRLARHDWFAVAVLVLGATTLVLGLALGWGR